MAATKVRYEKKGYNKVITNENEHKKWNFLMPLSLQELGKLTLKRYVDRKQDDTGFVVSRRKKPSPILLKQMILKYLEFAIEELIENGEVYFLKKRLYIKKIPSRKGYEHDKKWNGHEYVVFMDSIKKLITKEKEIQVEFTLGKKYREMLYEKVKNNWNYYEK